MAVPYFNPPEDVFDGRVGRKLIDTGTIPRPYTHYNNQVRRPSEHLYMGLRGGGVPPQMMVCVDDPDTYQEFYQRYYSGGYRSIDFYALPANAVQ